VPSGEDLKGKFYFRTAYRNEADFTVSNLQNQNDPTAAVKLSTLMVNDQTVSENYQRLIAQTLAGVYNTTNDEVLAYDVANPENRKDEQRLTEVVELLANPERLPVMASKNALTWPVFSITEVLMNQSLKYLTVVGFTGVLAACGSDGSSSSAGETGSVSVGLTDAPVDSAQAVNIEVTALVLQPSDGERSRFELEFPKPINLLDLQGGAFETLISDEEVPAGDYTITGCG
jgi:hypothetical protein